MGPSHRLLGGLAGVTVAAVQGQPWYLIGIAGLIAQSTSSGRKCSPDLDQNPAWVKVRKAAGSRLMNHRCITHWWGLPVAAAVGLSAVGAPWVAWMLLVGWVSHLVGDALFGKIPVDPWGRTRVGLGLDTDGLLEAGKWRGREVLPFAPVRVLMTGLIALVFVLAIGVPV